MGYEQRSNPIISALLGKSVQHVHRYAAFLQTIENGFSICREYVKRSQAFPEKGKIDRKLYEGINTIFDELFLANVDDDAVSRQFLIRNDVTTRAIDLVTGLLQQMKLLMDDTNAPLWNPGMSRPIVVVSNNDGQSISKMDSAKKKAKKAAGLSVCV